MAETTQVLLDEVPGPLSAKQRRFLELQQQSNRRLQDMIRDLLDLSRLEAGVMEYRFDTRAVRPILEAALAELGPLAGEREVRVELEAHGGLPPVRCDHQRMLQVVLNLLANAIRFSPRGGRVFLAAREVADEVRTWVRVTVGDQGPGVPDPEKAQVFERFYRVAGSHSRDRGGVGLGLAICREIVTAHGGRIGVEDAPGGGAVFVVDLAAATGATATPGEREGSA
jgi:signal transduction histidine kinase